MKILIIVVLCIASVLSGTISDPKSSLDDCKNILDSQSENFYYSRDENKISEDVHRLLEKAIETVNVTTTQLILKKCLNHIETIEHLGATFKPTDWAINYATELGAENIVRLLIRNHADVNALDKNNYGITPFIWAVRYSGNLIESGANETRNHIYRYIASMLIDANANISAASESGRTAMHEAAYNGAEKIVQLLLEKGVDVNIRDHKNFTPLHQTAKYHKVPMAELLIAKGAEISAKTVDGITPLHLAAIFGATDLLDLLINHGADINALDNSGNNVFHLIAKHRKSNRPYYADVVRFLIRNKADKNVQNNEGKTACDIAKEKGKTTIIPVLGCEA